LGGRKEGDKEERESEGEELKGTKLTIDKSKFEVFPF
jgi:hypothetical protein